MAGCQFEGMHKREQSPNLLDFPPVSTWREVYQGRWSKLKTVQKLEFVIEVAFFTLFFGLVVYESYLRSANLAGLGLAFAIVGAMFGGFFFLLRRSIR